MIPLRTVRGGFTLIEMLVVIAILAVVAGGVLQFQFGTSYHHSTDAQYLKNLVVQFREIAISNNCEITISLKDDQLKVETHTTGGAKVYTTDLSTALGNVPTSWEKFDGKLAEVSSQLADVECRVYLNDGSSSDKWTFNSLGTITDDEDRTIRIGSTNYAHPSSIKIHSITGLVEIN